MRADIPKEREGVIERESGGELPLRHARAGVHRPEKLKRTDEVRCEAEQAPAFAARLEDEMEKAVLQIAQAAVDEPRRSARCPTREIVFLHERDTKPAERGVARDAAAGDAAADDEEIELLASEDFELSAADVGRRFLHRKEAYQRRALEASSAGR